MRKQQHNFYSKRWKCHGFIYLYIQSSDHNTIFDVTMLKKGQTEKRAVGDD